jgi:23S rRNA pseudouridine1911/1915/1917 synthase
LDKPAGLLTIATDKEKSKTAYFKLTEYVRLKDRRARIFIVHRLDRDTSGLVVFAKDAQTKHFLQENWDKVTKRYYAVVEGTPKEKEGTIESYLAEDKFRRVYETHASKFSKRAITRFKVVKTSGRYSLLDVELVTGRKNQIRVHLSGLGHPVIGDEKYGSRANPAGRLGLHAYSLSIPAPTGGQPLVFKSLLPKMFSSMF